MYTSLNILAGLLLPRCYSDRAPAPKHNECEHKQLYIDQLHLCGRSAALCASFVWSVVDVNLEQSGSVQQKAYSQSFSLPGFMPYRGEFDVVSGEWCGEWRVVW